MLLWDTMPCGIPCRAGYHGPYRYSGRYRMITLSNVRKHLQRLEVRSVDTIHNGHHGT